MPKSKKRHIPKKKSQGNKPKPYEVIRHELVKIPNPFPDNISFETRLEIVASMGHKASEDFETEYLNLINYFKEYDPLYLLSFLSFYFLTTQEGIDKEAIDGYLDFHNFYIEILQCLSLKFERCISVKPLNENIDKFKTTIQQLCSSHSATYFKMVEKAKDEEDISAISLRLEIMNDTLAVRNWAYVDQMENMAYSLANLVESEFTTLFEINPNTLFDILFALTSLIEGKLNIHVQKIKAFTKAKTYNEVFDKYEANFPQIDKMNVEKREELYKYLGQNIKNLYAVLMAHCDLFLHEIYTVSITEIYEYLSQKIAEQDIRSVLEKLSYQFGDLSNINKDLIFLDNPIHAKPFIKIDDDHFFSSIPHIFPHIGVNLLEKWIATDKKLQQTYLAKKGKFLEKRVEQLFKVSFPNSQIVSGSIWECPKTKKTYENDLLVIVDDFAIIIECKSGAVSPSAKRGAPDRLFKTIEELVIAPSEQAIRFEEYLKQNQKIHNLKTKDGSINIIDSSKIKYYVPLGVTLSLLGTIGCNLKKIIDAGITDRKIGELAPSISFTDLEKIFEILTLRAEKIHYLSRRREFEAHLNFYGDEMDLFGFYLDNGFNIGETEYDESIYLNLILKSKELDPYFVGKTEGKKIKRPILKKSKYWQDVLEQLEQNSPNWLMPSYIMLNSQKCDHIKYEKNMKILVNKILQGKCTLPYNYMVMYCGPRRRQYAIIGLPYKDIDKQTRNSLINEIVASFDDKEYIRGLIILGYNLNFGPYPYSFVVGSLKTNFLDSLELH